MNGVESSAPHPAGQGQYIEGVVVTVQPQDLAGTPSRFSSSAIAPPRHPPHRDIVLFPVQTKDDTLNDPLEAADVQVFDNLKDFSFRQGSIPPRPSKQCLDPVHIGMTAENLLATPAGDGMPFSGVLQVIADLRGQIVPVGKTCQVLPVAE